MTWDAAGSVAPEARTDKAGLAAPAAVESRVAQAVPVWAAADSQGGRAVAADSAADGAAVVVLVGAVEAALTASVFREIATGTQLLSGTGSEGRTIGLPDRCRYWWPIPARKAGRIYCPSCFRCPRGHSIG